MHKKPEENILHEIQIDFQNKFAQIRQELFLKLENLDPEKRLENLDLRKRDEKFFEIIGMFLLTELATYAVCFTKIYGTDPELNINTIADQAKIAIKENFDL